MALSLSIPDRLNIWSVEDLGGMQLDSDGVPWSGVATTSWSSTQWYWSAVSHDLYLPFWGTTDAEGLLPAICQRIFVRVLQAYGYLAPVGANNLCVKNNVLDPYDDDVVQQCITISYDQGVWIRLSRKVLWGVRASLFYGMQLGTLHTEHRARKMKNNVILVKSLYFISL